MSEFKVLKVVGVAVLVGLALMGAYHTWRAASAMARHYTLLLEIERQGGVAAIQNWRATHLWLAEGLPNTKGADGKPLNRSVVLDALVKQAIRPASQVPTAQGGSKK